MIRVGNKRAKSVFANPAVPCVMLYFTAEKRLSNEFDCTIGAEPAT